MKNEVKFVQVVLEKAVVLETLNIVNSNFGCKTTQEMMRLGKKLVAYPRASNNHKSNGKPGPRLLGEPPKINIIPLEKDLGGEEEDSTDALPAVKIHDDDVNMRFLVCGVPCTLVSWPLYIWLMVFDDPSVPVSPSLCLTYILAVSTGCILIAIIGRWPQRSS